MCDYSNEEQASRPAKIGDQLVTAGIGEFDCVGMVSLDEPDVAVCLLPGSRLKITGGVSVALQKKLQISPTDHVTFEKRDVPAGQSDYSDSLHFDSHVSGELILLQDLPTGVGFEVLSVPAQTDVPANRERELEPA